jgi:hypothetical protein
MKAFIWMSENFEIIFRVIVQLTCTIFIYQKTQAEYSDDFKLMMRWANFPIVIVFTFWCLFTCKIWDYDYLRNFSVVIIIPSLFLLELWNAYLFVIKRERTKGGLEKIEDFMISLFTIHTFFLVMSNKKGKMKTKNQFMVHMDLILKRFKVQVKKYDRTFFKISYMLKKNTKHIRYLLCSWGMATGLFEATLFDLGFMFIYLAFIVKTEVNRYDWLKYILYLDGLILMKVFISNIPKSGVLLNAELMSILGFDFYPRSTFAL